MKEPPQPPKKSSSLTRDRLLEKGRELFEKGCQELRRGSKIMKLKLDTARLQHDRKAALFALGEAAYKIIKEGRLEAEDLEGWIQRIDALTKQIESQKAAIQETVKKDSV